MPNDPGIIRHFAVPKQKTQGVEQSLAGIAPAQSVQRGLRTERSHIQQTIAKRRGLRTFCDITESVLMRGFELKLKPPALDPEPQLQAEFADLGVFPLKLGFVVKRPV